MLCGNTFCCEDSCFLLALFNFLIIWLYQIKNCLKLTYQVSSKRKIIALYYAVLLKRQNPHKTDNLLVLIFLLLMPVNKFGKRFWVLAAYFFVPFLKGPQLTVY